MRSQDSDDLEEEGEVKVVIRQKPGRPSAPLPVPVKERTRVRFVKKVTEREPGEIIRGDSQELEPGEIPSERVGGIRARQSAAIRGEIVSRQVGGVPTRPAQESQSEADRSQYEAYDDSTLLSELVDTISKIAERNKAQSQARARGDQETEEDDGKYVVFF